MIFDQPKGSRLEYWDSEEWVSSVCDISRQGMPAAGINDGVILRHRYRVRFPAAHLAVRLASVKEKRSHERDRSPDPGASGSAA